MILSFHPCYEADTNILCAGRQPDEKDLSAIRDADAVVLPQGCREALYRVARNNCPHIFPHYDARFQYPGKTGQARLFQALKAPHPRTWVFEDTVHFRRWGTVATDTGFPFVFKLDWGGEGDTVFLLRTKADLAHALARAEAYERSGQRGFLLQALVPGSNRTLRVAVIGQIVRAYWRVQDNPFTFGTSVAKGAHVDAESDPDLRRKGEILVRNFCQQAGINLAGFDLIFNETGEHKKEPLPLFLEINYFFGRTGLGGSAYFFGMLQAEINKWLSGIGLHVNHPAAGAAPREKP